MATQPVVQIIGMKTLRRDLIKLDRDNVPKALVEAGLAVANPLVDKIRNALPVSDTNHAGRLRRSVRAGRVRTGATIRIGTKAVPYAGWVEFGGRRHSPHYSEREFVKDGRYIFPAARNEGPEAVQRYTDEIQKIIDSYPWSPPKD